LHARLIALVITFPLLLIAFVGWFIADEPLVDLRNWGAGNTMPMWEVADTILSACLPIVVLSLVLAALVVALRRARRQRTLAAAGNVVAAAIVVIGPAVAFSGHASHPDSPAAPYLLALVLGLLVGITILANAAAGVQSDRRTARLMVVPTATLNVVSLTIFVALVAYASDLVINGVPLIDPTLGAHVYPIDALPAGYARWLPALIVSVVASLAAFSGAAYAMVGIIRGPQSKAAPAVDVVIELDITSS